MATNVNSQVLWCYRGEDVEFNFTNLTATNIGAFTFAFTISDYPGQSPVVLTVPNEDITIDNVDTGAFTVPLTRAQTSALLDTDYYWDAWAIQPGGAQRLAGGRFTVYKPEYLPVPPS